MPETINRATGEPCQPSGWQGDGLDFELADSREVGPNYEWTAYHRDRLVRRGWARTKVGAYIAMTATGLRWRVRRA
jgi:hypothetical protein